MPSAGDVGRFAYCPHSWLLARTGHDSQDEATKAGIKAHASLGHKQRSAERVNTDYRQALSWSTRILALAASATLLTLEVLYLRAHPLHWIFLTTTLVLLSSSVGLMVIALDAQRRYLAQQREFGLVPGRLLATDLTGDGETLRDSEWGVSGRPDYVLQTDSGYVPVEVKTGRTPEKPHESHVLQLACYLRLVEVAHGPPPPYGLLAYPEGVFRVAWDDDVKTRLRNVLAAIGKAQETGVADRNHEIRGRCRGCSRRAFCDQSLV